MLKKDQYSSADDDEINPLEKVVFLGELFSICGQAQQKMGNNVAARDYFQRVSLLWKISRCYIKEIFSVCAPPPPPPPPQYVMLPQLQNTCYYIVNH